MLVFWGIPTGLTVLVTAITLVAALGLIELIGRPTAQVNPDELAGSAAAGYDDLTKAQPSRSRQQRVREELITRREKTSVSAWTLVALWTKHDTVG